MPPVPCTRTVRRSRCASAPRPTRIARRDWSLLDKMYGWLWQKQDQVPPSTAVGKAIAFTLGQWPKLIRYLDHAQRTNNSCEQETRPFVIGRKWRWTTASALQYGLIDCQRRPGAKRTAISASCSRSAAPCPHLRRLSRSSPLFCYPCAGMVKTTPKTALYGRFAPGRCRPAAAGRQRSSADQAVAAGVPGLHTSENAMEMPKRAHD